jgi:multidrug efflux pump subunit AcrB
MWIVRVALQRPYTFIVLAVLILLLGPLTIMRTPIDVFPNINLSVVTVIYRYGGLSPSEMGTRITGNLERYLPLSVNDVEHIESQSLQGICIIKIFFQPNVNLDIAIAQVTAAANSSLGQMPVGTNAPFILTYNASSVPIIQMALTSDSLSESDMFDLGYNFLRTQLATVQGASIPYPYGGRIRQIQIDLEPSALRAYGLAAQDVNAAVSAQNLILPTGTQKIGQFEYSIQLNGSPSIVEQLNDLPVKRVGDNLVRVRDVAHVRDGAATQSNIVRFDGKRAVLMSVQKIGSTSTLDIVEKIKARLPMARESAPEGLVLSTTSDQSLFVRSAVSGVVREGMIAAGLTGVMILLFLGSWRSTLIITISIPLSVLCAIMALSALGETINIMTLGGLALAVGILVDDATVAIENINWHLERGLAVEPAILTGAEQIAVPALVSTLCICIVFIPMYFLSGIAKFLFVPLGEAVVFAMLASYILSRTLVPTLAKYWLKPHDHAPKAADGLMGYFQRFQQGFERQFQIIRRRYRTLLGLALFNRRIFVAGFSACIVASMTLVPYLGEDFFPQIDGGQIKLHLRGHSGLRVEETARLSDAVQETIRQVIPPSDLESMADNIGLPNSGINLSYSNSAPIGTADADIQITLKPGHRPTADYVNLLRDRLAVAHPGVLFAFLPADIVGQILNFGLPAPIDIQISGQKVAENRAYAAELVDRMRRIPGIADLRIHQAFDLPEIRINVDRARAEELGFTQRDIASSLLVTLSGSGQTAPNYWLNPKTGVSYGLITQTPSYRMDSLDALKDLPLSGALATANGSPPQVLGAVADFSHGTGPAVVSHYNAQTVIDVFAAVQDRDLGSIARDLDAILADMAPKIPKGSQVISRGQIVTMTSSFAGLYAGLLFAVVLVYLLIVVNFQSWIDPLIIISALPSALAGIAWILFATQTTLSVPALTGAIMCMGVATANSILVISFARERMDHGRDALTAALEAGYARFRPVLMTAIAMIVGMVPMALGIGEGAEQNAPLGRAVIGGLSFATLATLIFVPCVFCLVHGRSANPARALLRAAE